MKRVFTTLESWIAAMPQDARDQIAQVRALKTRLIGLMDTAEDNVSLSVSKSELEDIIDGLDRL